MEINSDTLAQLDAMFRPALQGFADECMRTAMMIAPLIATIALLMRALYAYASQKGIWDELMEWLMPVLLTAFALGQYQALAHDWLWDGLMVGLAERGLAAGDRSLNTALENAVKIAINEEVRETAEQSIGTQIANLYASYMHYDTTLMGMAKWAMRLMYPLTIAVVYASIATASFFWAIGPLFIALIPLPWTRKYFDRWFGVFLGSMFSAMSAIVVITCFLGDETRLKKLTDPVIDSGLPFSECLLLLVTMLAVWFCVPRVVANTMKIFG